MNYNLAITRDHINILDYESKFLVVDSWLKSDLRSELDYARMLLDPTLFSYLHFKIDGHPAKLYPYQDMILNDLHRYKYFRAANQIGKSLALDLKAARNLLWNHGKGHNEAIVSKSLPQSTFQMRRVKSLLNTMPEIDWKDAKGETDNMSIISVDIKDSDDKVKYTNYLICAPCTEGLLGYDLHELNLDEFEFWDVDLQYFFEQIAQPRTYSTKGRITIFSNPNGSDNYGAQLERQLLLDGKTRKWHVYVFNFLDKPGNTVDEYEQLKHELPRHIFESTVAAVRSMSDRAFFTRHEIDGSCSKDLSVSSMIGKQTFFFLDVGAKHDQSCLIGGYIEPDLHNDRFMHLYIPIIHLYPVGYPITRVAGTEIDDSDGWGYEKSIKEYIEDWSVGGIIPLFGYDVTGNSGIQALFISMGIEGLDVTFSGPNKSGYYQRFKYMMEKCLLHRIPHKEWEKQASEVIVTRGQRGYWLVNAVSVTDKKSKSLDHKLKSIPDDCLDATAGLIHLTDPHSCVEASASLTII